MTSTRLFIRTFGHRRAQYEPIPQAQGFLGSRLIFSESTRAKRTRRRTVLHKCANSACSNLFRRLSQGKLFQVEAEYSPALARNGRMQRRVEYYWLCDECSCFLTLTFERGRGMTTIPLPQPGRKPVTAVQLDALRPPAPQAVSAGSAER